MGVACGLLNFTINYHQPQIDSYHDVNTNASCHNLKTNSCMGVVCGFFLIFRSIYLWSHPKTFDLMLLRKLSPTTA